MSIINLTQDLENFKWTDYDNVGDNNSLITREHERAQFNTPQSFYDGHSKVVTGQKTFNRPDKQALADMESRFGPFDTQPPDERGPYGIADYMDGRQRGRGFTAPGQAPLGFIVDMESLTGGVISQLYIDGSISLTPLSHVVAGVNSSLDYGVVPEKMIMLGPAAEGAWGVKTLPISTYSSRILSREELEGYTSAPVGGRVYYYGRLESLYNKDSMFQKEDGTYSTPTGQDLTVPGSPTEFQNFMEYGGRGIQRTFEIPAAYPKNTTAYTINTQFGWTHQSNYLEIHGTAWRGFGLTTTVESQIDEVGYGGITPSFYPPLPGQDQIASQTPHPMNTIYLNSEPVYGAPSYLELQFNINYGLTDGIWPYGVLGYSNPNTTGPHVLDNHPFIRKTVGQRYEIPGDFFDKPDFSWMALQLKRTAEDTTRINKWLATPEGELWQEKQHILQNLNPREETRDWSRSNLILSIPPFFHATRHFGGETYMDVEDFGSFTEGVPPQGTSFGGMLGKWWSGTKVGKVAREVGDFMEAADETIGGAVAGLDSLFGGIDFNEKGGRLHFLTDKMIKLTKDDGGFGGALTNMRSAYTPFGRPPKVPTQVVFSQKGALGIGHANAMGLDRDLGEVINQYRTLSYGDIPGKISKRGNLDTYEQTLMSPGRLLDKPRVKWEKGTEKIIFDQKTTEGKVYEELSQYRKEGQKIVKGIGDPGLPFHQHTPVSHQVVDDGLGVIKKAEIGDKYISERSDKINMTPYGWDNDTIKDNFTKDFIKFKFRDITNDKYIIFRAILSGISDSITPEWGDMRYIGRPEKVYVYQGADRAVSFTFDVYPKTKQELPVLWEKLNYLVGLCYPTYYNNRMIAPFIELTIGDMFNRTPGFLSSLTLDVDDNSTWEIDEGLQLPKHITCNCSFTYVGKYIHHQKGKHYELGWLPDGTSGDRDSTLDLGFANFPNRNHGGWDLNKKGALFGEIQAEPVPPVEE